MASNLQPPNDYYALDKALELKKMTIPNQPNITAIGMKPANMGIVILTNDQELMTVYGNAALNHLRFNEPLNRMGMKIAALVMDRMATIKTTPIGTPAAAEAAATPSKGKGGKDAERESKYPTSDCGTISLQSSH